MENKERYQRAIVKIIHGALLACMILAQMPAAALPGMGDAVPRQREYDPRLVVGEGFQQLLGRDLSNKEYQQIETFLLALEEAQQSPIQKASFLPNGEQVNRFLTRLMDFSEVLPVICLYGKVSVKLPGTATFAVNGFSAAYEITPCLVLNSVMPWKLRVSEFRSYVLKGGTIGAAEGKLGALAAGVVAGLYAGPKSLARPLIGEYLFSRFAIQKSGFKVIYQGAVSSQGQKMVMVGVGGELSIDNMASLILNLAGLPKLDIQGLKPGQRRGELGTYYSVYEHPWFSRLLQGMSPVAAFADIDQYIAANP